MSYFFTADLHFGDRRMLTTDFMSRPFSDYHRMDSALIRNFNHRVRARDIVFVLGDVFGPKVSARGRDNIFHALHGEKHLIVGNHDDRKTLDLPWASRQGSMEIDWLIGGVKLHLSHYPFRGAQVSGKDFYLHGHTHKRRDVLSGSSLDVGVDGNNLKPYRLADIRAIVEEHIAGLDRLRALMADQRRGRA